MHLGRLLPAHLPEKKGHNTTTTWELVGTTWELVGTTWELVGILVESGCGRGMLLKDSSHTLWEVSRLVLALLSIQVCAYTHMYV